MKEKLIIHQMAEPTGYGAFDNQDEPEEQLCPKCGELDEECECAYYDQIELTN